MQAEAILQQIVRYPLKSCRGHSIDQAEITALGIEGDRRLILAEPDGRFITARTEPQLLQISVIPHQGGWRASHPNAESLVFASQSSGFGEVEVWGRRIKAPRLRAAEAWFSAVIQRPVQLLFNDAQAKDQADKRYPWGPIFSDGYPLLVCNTASLDAVNAASGGNFEMARFRANLVIETNLPWCEDDWGRLQIGDVVLERQKSCERCVLTTRDPETTEKHPQQEPLRTLTRLGRQMDGAVLFGQNFSVLKPGRIETGTAIQLID